MSGNATRRRLADVQWYERAACLGTDIEVFYAPRHQDEAKALCGRCAARDDCLTAATREEAGTALSRRWGIRAGLDPEERHGGPRSG